MVQDTKWGGRVEDVGWAVIANWGERVQDIGWPGSTKCLDIWGTGIAKWGGVVWDIWWIETGKRGGVLKIYDEPAGESLSPNASAC